MVGKNAILRMQRSGVLASVYFALIVLIGILTVDGFNAIDQVISSLYERGARNGLYFQIAFIVYNLILAVFGASVILTAGRSRKRKAAGILGGIVDDLTPQDRAGRAVTLIGQIHWLSTGIAFLLMLALMVLVTAWISGNLKGKGFAVYSIISTVLVLCAGSISGVAIPMRLPLWGIYETIVMSAFLLWMALLSFKLKSAIADSDLPGAGSGSRDGKA